MFAAGLVGAQFGYLESVDDFLRQARPGDFLLTSQDLNHPGLALVRSKGGHRLYVRN
jgi:hypothetical protein